MLAYGIPGEKAVNFLKAPDLFQCILSSDDIDNKKKITVNKSVVVSSYAVK